MVILKQNRLSPKKRMLMNKDVIVLGAHYSTMLGVVRSVGEADYNVVAYFIGSNGYDVVKYSKYVKKFIHISRKDDSVIINKILDYQSKEKTVIIPSDDYTSSLVDRFRDKLSDRFLLPYVEGNKQGAITHLMDKSVQCKLAEEAGINVAKTIALDLRDDNLSIPEGVLFPCYVKPCISAESSKAGMCKCDDMASLQKAVDWFKKDGKNSKILVQEFLDIQDEIQLTGICSDEQIYLPAVIKRIITSQKPKGCTLYGEVQPSKCLGNLYDKIITMLKGVHYTGLIVVDLIEANGKIYFSELNFRSSGVLYAMTMANVNLPEKFIKLVSGMKDSSIFKDNVDWGMRFINEKVLIENMQAGYTSHEEYKQLINNTQKCIIRRADDIQPYKIVKFMYNPSIVCKIIRRCKRFIDMLIG